MRRLLIFSALLQLHSLEVFAYVYHGRASVGGFISKETHEPEPQGATSNDFATASARFYYQGTQFSDSPLIFTTDLRDKNDFFNKYDQERKELTNRNTLQLRQLSLRRETKKGFIWELGRYAIPDAGSVFNDGGTLGLAFNSAWSTELFGGLNPKADDKSYLEFNDKASSFGGLINYIPKNNSWTSRKELHLAHVTQVYDSDTDRQYLYEQSVVQWGARNLISTMLYYDFIPRAYIQNGQLMYSQLWTEKLSTNFLVLTYDVIEYRRRQDLRETLQASPYQEVALKTFWQRRSDQRWSVQGRYGKREIDNYERASLLFELVMPRYFSKNVDFALRAAQKKEFTKEGTYAGFGIGYYTNKKEYDLAMDTGIEKQTDGSDLHPIIVDANYGFQISKKYFGATGLQYQQDEKVKIYSALFKVTYRFGNKEISPIRDGAPPGGRL